MIRSQIIIDNISDHLPTCVIPENINIGVKERKRITMRKMSKRSINLICNDLSEVNWAWYISNNCNDSDNVNTVFNCIHNKICDSVNRHAPLKEHTVKIRNFKSESWITKGIKRSSMVLKKLYKKTLKEGCDDLTCETYVSLRLRVQNGISCLISARCVNCLISIPEYSRIIDYSIIWLSTCITVFNTC